MKNLLAKIRAIPQTLKLLPIKTKRLVGLGAILALTIALPLFVWAIVNLNFNPFKKAATGEPGGCVAQDKTIIVTPIINTNGTCHNIQTAINAVTGDGFTIQISPGDYNVTDTINIVGKTNLSITGTPNGNISRTWISFNTNGWGFKISDSSGSIQWLRAEGLTPNGLLSIQNSNNFLISSTILVGRNSHTLDVHASQNVSISNSEIQSSAGALEMNGSTGIHILNNKIHNSDNAISINDSQNIEVLGNLITENDESAVRLQNITDLAVGHNTMVKNAQTGSLFPAIAMSGTMRSGINFTDNIVTNNKGVGISFTGANFSISPSPVLSRECRATCSSPNQWQRVGGSRIECGTTTAGAKKYWCLINPNTPNPTMTFQRNDVWSNSGGNYVGVPDQTGANGNISADPLINWGSPSLCLLPGSPAIYGNPASGEYMGYISLCSFYPTSPTPSSSPVLSRECRATCSSPNQWQRVGGSRIECGTTTAGAKKYWCLINPNTPNPTVFPSPTPTAITSATPIVTMVPTPTPVSANRPPVISTVSAVRPAGFTSIKYNDTLKAYDWDLGDNLTGSISGLPRGLNYVCSLNKSDRLNLSCNITGIPKTSGLYNLLFTVDDGQPNGKIKKRFYIAIFKFR